jgi:hypothetical protein
MLSCSHWGIFVVLPFGDTDGIDWSRYWFATHEERAEWEPRYWHGRSA